MEKETCLVRRIDYLGRIAIPKNIREMLAFREEDPIVFSIDPDERSVKLKKWYSESLLVSLLDDIEKTVRFDENYISNQTKADLLETIKEMRTKIQNERG